MGDLNNDGYINLTDLVCMLRHISAEKSNKNSDWILKDEKLTAGDIIKNQKIDSSDVLALLRYIAANKSLIVAEKHQEWLEINQTEEPKEPSNDIEENYLGPKIKKIEAISEAGNYETGSIIQIKVTFDKKIYADKNKVALSSSTVPVLNISFGKGEIKHPYITEDSNIENYIIYHYQITKEDQGKLKVNGAKAFDGTKTIYDDAGNTVTLIAGKDLTGNIITANIISENEKSEDQNITNVEVSEINLNKTTLTIDENNGERLLASVQPSNASDIAITWSSSNNDIATVSENGFVMAKKEGSVTISAKTSNNKIATCQVIVKNSVPTTTSISLNKTILNMKKDDGEKLTATVYPSNTNQFITWSSSNNNIAVVSNTGFISAKNSGTATITAKTENGKIATCKVIVSPYVVTQIIANSNVVNLQLLETEKENVTYKLLSNLVTIKPIEAEDNALIWKTSNSKVATFENSKLIAKGAGTATITVTLKSNSNITTTFKVIVEDKTPKPSTPTPSTPTPSTPNVTTNQGIRFTEEEIQAVAYLMNHEMGMASQSSKICVLETVRNMCHDRQFKSTIKGNLTYPARCISTNWNAYFPGGPGYKNSCKPSASDLQLARNVMSGKISFLNNPKVFVWLTEEYWLKHKNSGWLRNFKLAYTTPETWKSGVLKGYHYGVFLERTF